VAKRVWTAPGRVAHGPHQATPGFKTEGGTGTIRFACPSGPSRVPSRNRQMSRPRGTPGHRNVWLPRLPRAGLAAL